jgi:hypothetical protein
VIRADAPSAARPTHTAPRHSRMITYGPYRHPYVRLRSHALCPRYSDDGAATAITTATRRSRQRRNGSVLKVAGANELRSAQGPRHDERERRDHASRCVEAGWQHQGLGTPAPKGGKEATTVKNSWGDGSGVRARAPARTLAALSGIWAIQRGDQGPSYRRKLVTEEIRRRLEFEARRPRLRR